MITAPVNVGRDTPRDVIREQAAALLALLGDRSVDLAATAASVDAADRHICDKVGTTPAEARRILIALRTARDHIDSAWRSLDYATRCITEGTT